MCVKAWELSESGYTGFWGGTGWEAMGQLRWGCLKYDLGELEVSGNAGQDGTYEQYVAHVLLLANYGLRYSKVALKSFAVSASNSGRSP